MAPTYAPIAAELGVMLVGCNFAILAMPGVTTDEHTTTVAMFRSKESGVRTCSLTRAR